MDPSFHHMHLTFQCVVSTDASQEEKVCKWHTGFKCLRPEFTCVISTHISLARIGHMVSPTSKSTEKYSLPVFPEKGEEPGRSEHLLSLLKGFQQNNE